MKIQRGSGRSLLVLIFVVSSVTLIFVSLQR
jgi:hypothetical protein